LLPPVPFLKPFTVPFKVTFQPNNFGIVWGFKLCLPRLSLSQKGPKTTIASIWNDGACYYVWPPLLFLLFFSVNFPLFHPKRGETPCCTKVYSNFDQIQESLPLFFPPKSANPFYPRFWREAVSNFFVSPSPSFLLTNSQLPEVSSPPLHCAFPPLSFLLDTERMTLGSESPFPDPAMLEVIPTRCWNDGRLYTFKDNLTSS